MHVELSQAICAFKVDSYKLQTLKPNVKTFGNQYKHILSQNDLLKQDCAIMCKWRAKYEIMRKDSKYATIDDQNHKYEGQNIHTIYAHQIPPHLAFCMSSCKIYTKQHKGKTTIPFIYTNYQHSKTKIKRNDVVKPNQL